MSKCFVPIYEKDGNEIIILDGNFVGEDEQQAQEIGLGTMLVECILWGMKFLRVQEIDPGVMPHKAATLEGVNVAIIAGPDGPQPAEVAAAIAALRDGDGVDGPTAAEADEILGKDHYAAV